MKKELSSFQRSLCFVSSQIFACILLPFAALGQNTPSTPGPGETNIVLETWTFDNNTNFPWASDDGYPPRSFTNLNESSLGQGYALVVDSKKAASLRYNCNETDGHTNITVSQGTIMFWFAATSWASTNEPGGTGPGTWARLLEVGQYTTNASYGWFSLYLDPAGANLYFSSQTNNGSQDTYLSAAMDFKTNRWHHLALVYDSTNSILFVDGVCVTNGPPIAYWPGPEVLTNGFTIGSDATGILQAHGMFDNFETYGYPVDSNTIAGEFYAQEIYFLLNPMNAANLTQAPSQPVTTPSFEAITGSGFLTAIATNANCTTSSNIWLTNITASVTNDGTVNLTFTIAGGSNGCLYDVFATPALEYPLTNGQWYWMGQGQHCVTYLLTNLPSYSAMLILGTPQDSDNDGLTDPYELLVSHTDPDNPDTFGVGMSDGWQVAYLGGVGFNGYTLCPSGDGWTYIQAYQNGCLPNEFCTPPAPTGLTASYIGGVVSVSWDPSPGPVMRYVIKRDIPALGATNFFTNSASSTSYQDNPFPINEPDLSSEGPPTYEVTVVYPGGYSAPSKVALYGNLHDATSIPPGYDTGTAALVRGQAGAIGLLWSAMPTNIVNVDLLVGFYQWPAGYFASNWLISMNQFTNGIYQLPSSIVQQFSQSAVQYCYLIATNSLGRLNVAQVANIWLSKIPFLDGREQLKENLAFVLRVATVESALRFTWEDTGGSGWYAIYDYPSSYAYSGFYDINAGEYGSPFGSPEYGPFIFNAQYRNFVFGNTNDLGSDGFLDTGVVISPVSGDTYLYSPSAFSFGPLTNSTSIPPLLTPAESQWIYSPVDDLGSLGVTWIGDDWIMSPSPTNGFGLPYLGLDLVWGNLLNSSQLLYPGGSIPHNGGTFYCNVAQPELVTVGYYFTQLPSQYPNSPLLSPLPGQVGFSTTNTSPPLIAGFGDPYFKVVGYAKQDLQNGNPGVFGYLGQYFEAALLINPDGNVSTNRAGILSEYGDFLPTLPGPVALITMTNLDTGERGTGVVNVIKLQLDVNHDGFMDTSFAGPDNTSPQNPYVFWANNDFDRAHTVDSTDWEEDDLSPSDENSDSPWNRHHPTPDLEYRNGSGKRVIPSSRDLEDFARLWVCGINTNLLSALPPGTVITLDWGDVGAPDPSNPTIDVFHAADSDGGIAYLTNLATAALQTNASGCPYVARLGPGEQIQLNGAQFGNGWAGNFFIWCGVSNGFGALTLTVSQGGTNTFGQTRAYIQLTDIKQRYERWTVGDSILFAPTNVAHLANEEISQPFHYDTSADASVPYILFVHGWNMERYDKDRFAESAFKRLYWQGYQGRFGSFRWPTGNRFTGITAAVMDTYNYDRSESNAWSSANGLLNLLTNLDARYAGNVYLMAHSMGNITAGEALRLAKSNEVVNTYAAMQAAVPSHTYDPLAPVRALNSTGINLDSGTPNCYLNYWTPGSPCYFNGTSGAASYVNFFNTNDWALGWWEYDQDIKPDIGYAFDGTNFWHNTLLLLFPVDTYEIFARADEARCYAVGAQPNLGGPFRTSTQVDLQTVWPPDTHPRGAYREHVWHSAQFRSDIASRWDFWQALLGPAAFDLR